MKIELFDTSGNELPAEQLTPEAVESIKKAFLETLSISVTVDEGKEEFSISSFSDQSIWAAILNKPGAPSFTFELERNSEGKII